MHLLVIGKLPPIQGGVSAETFAISAHAAKNNIQVSAITNSSATPPGFSMLFLDRDKDFIASHSELEISTIGKTEDRAYIPFAQPFLSALVGRALAISDQKPIDVIYASYFEPYCVAAATVSRQLKIPLILRHAGSDLGRLSMNPDLARAYRYAVESATKVVSPLTHVIQSNLNTSSFRAQQIYPPKLPHWHNCPEDKGYLKDFLCDAPKWFNSLGLDEVTTEHILIENEKLFEDVPTIGCIGKVGDVKGTNALISALAELSKRRVKFNFLFAAAGHQSVLNRYFQEILRCDTFKARTWFLPPMPPWQVPNFLARCDVIAYLENRFPIAFHRPTLLREILASGRVALVSGELAGKASMRGNLVSQKNCVVVDDPLKSDDLIKSLEAALTNTDLRISISYHAKALSNFLEEYLPTWDDYINEFMRLD